MIKKLFAFNIALVLLSTSMSCSSLKKNKQETKEKTEITEQESGVKVEESTKKEELKKEDNVWEWVPADENCDAPVEIIQPDGTKIRIPKKGVLSNKKASTHIETFEKKKDSIASKKTTRTKKKTNTLDKDVERKTFPWWVIIVLGAITTYFIWNERK